MASLPKEHAQLIAELFKSVVEIDPQDRDAFLTERCRSNPALRTEVESLLQTHDGAERFMERSALDLAAGTFIYTGAFAPGQVIGSYEIISLIGKGGMGEVYLAQDRQLRRQVALKLVRRGMATEDIIRRFHQEQQLLAGLNHPNIAQLYEAGLTPDGIPFFAMEHAGGTRIDHYCREKRLSIQQRLELFVKVCAAVQYAHQHLVVHRDIKPSNILVTSDGDPKLLDFGIAKLLDAVTNIAPEQTITVQNVLTPEYASPEHVRGEPITTASDVYSLGVLLYELLTEAKPYKIDNRTPIEIARVITESEPAKPSMALGRGAALRRPDSAARCPYHAKQLQGDLDNIVLKAQRKEAQRRYASVAEFSADIRRHLDGLPVRARKDTFAYRTSKFVVRNRLAVTAAVLVFMSLAGGLAISIRQAQIARRETIKAEAVSNFLQQMLGAASPGATLRGSKEKLTVKEVLDQASNDLASQHLSHQPELKAELLRVIGTCYYELGQYDLAEQNLRSALQLQSRIYGDSALETLKTKLAMAALWLERGEIVKGDAFYAQTIPTLRREQQRGRIGTDYLLQALYEYGLTRRLLSDPKQGEDLLREALSLSSQAPSDSEPLIDEVESVLTLTLCDQGKFGEAEEILRKQLESFRQRGAAVTNAAKPVALGTLAVALMEQGKLTEAEKQLREAEEIYRRNYDPAYVPLGNDLRLLADVLYRKGEYAEAETKIDETLKIYRASSGPGYTNYPTALTIQGLIYAKTARPAEAEKLLREAVQLRSQNVPEGHFMKALAIGALGEFLTEQNRFAEAEPLLLNSYESLTKSQIPKSPRLQTALQRLITLYEKWNKPDLATKYRAALR